MTLGVAFFLKGESAYVIVDVKIDHKTFTMTASTMVDRNDVAGLSIHCAYRVGRAKK